MTARMTRAELAEQAGLRPTSVGAANLVQHARDVSVGDRIQVTVAVVPADHDLYNHEPRDLVTDVVTVDEVVVMHCGCSRVGFARPRSQGGPCPRVHLFSAGCRWAGGHADAVDFAQARAAAERAA